MTSIDFGEKLNKEVMDLLEDIKEHWLLSPDEKDFFQYSVFPDMAIENRQDSVNAQTIIEKKTKILNKLQHLGALEAIIDKDSFAGFDCDFLVKINKKKFEEIFTDLKNEIDSIPKAKDGKIHLYFDKDANLYLDSKDSLCYSIEKDSKRKKILDYLVDNTGFQSPDDIAEYTDHESAQHVRSEIKKMRDKIKEFIKLDDVIESSRSSGGYRISPAYKVIKI